MVAIDFKDEATGIERDVRAIVRKERSRKRVSRHLVEAGVPEHFMEDPGIGRINRISNAAATGAVGPFVNVQGFGMGGELR